MTTTTDQWAWWRAALAGTPVETHEGDIHSGFFFAKASRAGGRIPVAVWRDGEGALICRVGTKADKRLISEDEAQAKWTYIAKHPVSREDYLAAYESGSWPDGTPTTAPDKPAQIGDNAPSDPFEALRAEVEDKLQSAEDFLAARNALGKRPLDQTKSDAARNLQASLLDLKKRGDALFKAEKDPILKAARDCDDKYRFREALETCARKLRDIYESFLKAERQRQEAAAQARYESERRAAEIARKTVEEQRAKLLRDDPIAALTEPVLDLPPIPTAPEPVKVQVGGGVGRRAGLKEIWVPTIVDYQQTLLHYADNPSVRVVIEKLVAAETKLKKNTTAIPGVTVKQDWSAA